MDHLRREQLDMMLTPSLHTQRMTRKLIDIAMHNEARREGHGPSRRVYIVDAYFSNTCRIKFNAPFASLSSFSSVKS